MKKNIHPNYYNIIASCSCGRKINIESTLSKNLTLDICNKCHPFCSGKRKIVDTKGRVDLFNKKFKHWK